MSIKLNDEKTFKVDDGRVRWLNPAFYDLLKAFISDFYTYFYIQINYQLASPQIFKLSVKYPRYRGHLVVQCPVQRN